MQIANPSTAGAKGAALLVKPLRTFPHPRTGTALTLALFTLETGRSHQIRVQSAAEKHPLAGDTKYGGESMRELFHRPALHSCSLRFFHPMSKEALIFTEDFAFDFSSVIP